MRSRSSWSFPVRERGLKHPESIGEIVRDYVVPRAGTWIETINQEHMWHRDSVVPRAGTWIETLAAFGIVVAGLASFPVRERGLKHDKLSEAEKLASRSPCGNVD